MSHPAWSLPDRTIQPEQLPLVMGVVNITPDSFSDGGRYFDAGAAVAHGVELVRQGADLLDLGAESSRPGSQPVPADEQLRRLLPVLGGLTTAVSVPLSIDTTRAEVADQTIAAGAHIINDITALGEDADMAAVVRRRRAGLVLMHMLGTPATMQIDPVYEDVVGQVREFLEARLQRSRDLGIADAQVVLDPGIGFGKTVEHNLRLLAGLAELGRAGRPVLLGVSRKGFIGKILGRDVGDRPAGSLACACHALAAGSAQILRVHDVAATRDAVRMFRALHGGGW